MAFRDFDYEREYDLVPDLVKQFVVYLYRHIRSAAISVCAGGGSRVPVQCCSWVVWHLSV